MRTQPRPRNRGAKILPLVLADLRERDRKGRATYGDSLRVRNGRSALQDAYEEALDLAMYLRQEIERRRR